MMDIRTNDSDVEIMFVTNIGELISEERMTVKLSKSYSRRILPAADESAIERIWNDRLKNNPRLFNGTKFRVHSVSKEDRDGCDFNMNLSVTDYREYLGTNWSPNAGELQKR